MMRNYSEEGYRSGSRNLQLSFQCDRSARLFAQHLAIYSNSENLHNGIQKMPKVG